MLNVRSSPGRLTIRSLIHSQGLARLVKILDPTFDSRRLCIKVPATYEGLEACRVLEAEGIATLATTLFTMAQAALAGEVGCHYIAPYLNELRVQVDKE